MELSSESISHSKLIYSTRHVQVVKSTLWPTAAQTEDHKIRTVLQFLLKFEQDLTNKIDSLIQNFHASSSVKYFLYLAYWPLQSGSKLIITACNKCLWKSVSWFHNHTAMVVIITTVRIFPVHTVYKYCVFASYNVGQNCWDIVNCEWEWEQWPDEFCPGLWAASSMRDAFVCVNI